jgi:hypothetical protein
MKRVAFFGVVLLAGLGLGFGLGVKYAGMTSQPTPAKSAAVVAQKPPSGQLPPNVTTMSEWQEFRAARDKTLQDNPDLAAEYQALQDAMKKQQESIEEAMAKTDPTVAPILAKLEWQRRQSMAAASKQIPAQNVHQ